MGKEQTTWSHMESAFQGGTSTGNCSEMSGCLGCLRKCKKANGITASVREQSQGSVRTLEKEVLEGFEQRSAMILLLLAASGQVTVGAKVEAGRPVRSLLKQLR